MLYFDIALKILMVLFQECCSAAYNIMNCVDGLDWFCILLHVCLKQ